MNPYFHSIEVLEVRIAPASVFITYTDLDGDLVKIKATNNSSVPAPLDLGDLSFIGGGSSGQLATLNLTDLGFANASIAFSVAKKPGGDGLANVGRINATGIDLGTVNVKGDLGALDAGSGAPVAVQSLVARSIGLYGIATQGGVGDLTSDIAGSLGGLKVLSDFRDAHLRVFGSASTTIGPITIQGSLIGGLGFQSGWITCTGDVGAIFVGGDIIGGAGGNAGGIDVAGKIKSVTVRGSVIGGGGSFFVPDPESFHEGQIFAKGDIGKVKIGRHVIGGNGFASGEIRSFQDIASITIGGSLIGGLGFAGGHLAAQGDMGPVKIGGDIIGGGGALTGYIEGFGKTASVTIRGSLIGGSGSVTGFISSAGGLGSVKIGGDLLGGSIDGLDPTVQRSGGIQSSAGRIESVRIGGSIIAGGDAGNIGALTQNASIVAFRDIGSIFVGGNVIGNLAQSGMTRVQITAQGQEMPVDGVDLAIGRIRIGGRVDFTDILAGYTFGPQNGNAQIGAVTIGGDWRASNLVAGIRDTGTNGFGNVDDTVIAQPPADSTVSKISSVLIRGAVFGTTDILGDQFGFTAQQIGSFKVGGKALVLTAGTDGIFPLATVTGDVHLREVP